MKIEKAGFLFILFSNICFAGQEDIVKYTDVFTFQMDHRESWAPGNLGFNLSRYFVVEGINEEYGLFPGIGMRAKVGQNPKIEVFPKLAWAGLLGGSSGAYYSGNGVGFGASVWAGLQFFGAEYSFYADGGGVENEFSFYLALQFGVHRNGRYGFENWFFIPWSWKMF